MEAKLPPVVREQIVKNIDRLIRKGDAFTLRDVLTVDLIDLVDSFGEELRGGRITSQYISIHANNLIKQNKYKGKIWKRFDRATSKAERKEGAFVYYPSNDEKRFHLKDNEIFVDGTMKNQALSRMIVEPPVRITHKDVHDSAVQELLSEEPKQANNPQLLIESIKSDLMFLTTMVESAQRKLEALENSSYEMEPTTGVEPVTSALREQRSAKLS